MDFVSHIRRFTSTYGNEILKPVFYPIYKYLHINLFCQFLCTLLGDDIYDNIACSIPKIYMIIYSIFNTWYYNGVSLRKLGSDFQLKTSYIIKYHINIDGFVKNLITGNRNKFPLYPFLNTR